MRKFFLRLLLFIPFFLLIYVVLTFLVGSLLPDYLTPNLYYRTSHFSYTLAEIGQVQEPDILVVGSSHAYRGFDPRIFDAHGFELLNLGSSSQTPVQTEYLLSRYIDDIDPELIIYEVWPSSFTSDGVESAVDLISNDTIAADTLGMVATVNDIKAYNSLIFASLNQVLGIPAQEPVLEDQDLYVGGGYVERSDAEYSPGAYPSQRYQWRDYQFQAFDAVIALLEERDIPFVLVQAPITDGYFRSYTNNDEFDETMRTYGPYYNFNYIMDDLDSTHFFDAHHLNQSGVELFNRRLIQILLQEELHD